jgi:hypothetical protein
VRLLKASVHAAVVVSVSLSLVLLLVLWSLVRMLENEQ